MEDVLKLEKHCPRFYYFLRGLRRKYRLQRYRKLTTLDIMGKNAKLFEERFGRPLDWYNLHSYNEKLQWEKLFHEDPVKTILADKYRVREWVSERIGDEYLIPLIGVWNNADEIQFEDLPRSFVLKTNCASGDVVVVKDKNTLTKKDITRIKCKLNFYLRYDWGYQSFELHYSKIKPLIIAEELLPSGDSDVPDYKFTCFDGQPYCCRVDAGRYHRHRRNTYDLEWNLLPWNAGLFQNIEYDLPKPKNFELMVELARKLSKGLPQVRADFYNVDGKIYFGEMTLTSGSGFEPFVPESMDYTLGEMWNQECRVPDLIQ